MFNIESTGTAKNRLQFRVVLPSVQLWKQQRLLCIRKSFHANVRKDENRSKKELLVKDTGHNLPGSGKGGGG